MTMDVHGILAGATKFAHCCEILLQERDNSMDFSLGEDTGALIEQFLRQKDLKIPKMDKVNFEPDITFNAPRKQLRDCNRRSVSDIQISVHCIQEHSTDSHMNYTYNRFHELHQNSSNTGLYEEKTGNNYTCSRRHRHNCNTRDSGVISASGKRTIRPSIPTEAGPSRLSHTHHSISHKLLTANLPQRSRPSSKCSSNSQRYSPEIDPHYHSRALSHTVPRHHARPSCRELSSANTDNRFGRAAANVSLQVQSGECDPEIVKDIVRTLRIVGDQLDTKMRNCSEPFHYTLLDAVKVNAGQLLLTTVKQFNLVGVALDSSLALLKLLNQ